MTISECYQALGGDYSQAQKRLFSDQNVERFITKFLDDRSYSQLCQAMQNGQRKEAFLAAQTLESVSANLSFEKLFGSAQQLARLLRLEADTIPQEAAPILEQVNKDYRTTVDSIRTYLASSKA